MHRRLVPIWFPISLGIGGGHKALIPGVGEELRKKNFPSRKFILCYIIYIFFYYYRRD